MQAKDISDLEILGLIESLDDGKHWVKKRALYDGLGKPPEKVFRAKLRAIYKRGLAEGCDLDWCGCWGWSVTDRGRELLAVAGASTGEEQG